jgi:hypothetical protein
MAKRNSPMRKHSVLLAAALLVMSTGIAAAKTHRLVDAPIGTGVTGEPSSTNPLAGGGPAGYFAPHEVPENGGAASTVQPDSNSNWR